VQHNSCQKKKITEKQLFAIPGYAFRRPKKIGFVKKADTFFDALGLFCTGQAWPRDVAIFAGGPGKYAWSPTP